MGHAGLDVNGHDGNSGVAVELDPGVGNRGVVDRSTATSQRNHNWYAGDIENGTWCVRLDPPLDEERLATDEISERALVGIQEPYLLADLDKEPALQRPKRVPAPSTLPAVVFREYVAVVADHGSAGARGKQCRENYADVSIGVAAPDHGTLPARPTAPPRETGGAGQKQQDRYRLGYLTVADVIPARRVSWIVVSSAPDEERIGLRVMTFGGAGIGELAIDIPRIRFARTQFKSICVRRPGRHLRENQRYTRVAVELHPRVGDREMVVSPRAPVSGENYWSQVRVEKGARCFGFDAPFHEEIRSACEVGDRAPVIVLFSRYVEGVNEPTVLQPTIRFKRNEAFPSNGLRQDVAFVGYNVTGAQTSNQKDKGKRMRQPFHGRAPPL